MDVVPSLRWVDALNVMGDLSAAEAAVGPAIVPRSKCTMPPRMGIGPSELKVKASKAERLQLLHGVFLIRRDGLALRNWPGSSDTLAIPDSRTDWQTQLATTVVQTGKAGSVFLEHVPRGSYRSLRFTERLGAKSILEIYRLAGSMS